MLLDKWLSIVKNNLWLIRSTLWIFLSRALTVILPIFVYPHLYKNLGSEIYGVMVWVMAITGIIAVLVNSGYLLTSTKKIKESQYNANAQSEIILNTFLGKITIYTFASLIFIILVIFFDRLAQQISLFTLALIIVFTESLMPLWYFHGNEKIRILAVMTALPKVLYGILIIFFINGPDKIYLTMVIQIFSNLFCVAIAYYLIKKELKKFFLPCKYSEVWMGIKAALSVAVPSSISTLREAFIAIVIDVNLGSGANAALDLIQKIVNVLITPFHVVSSMLYTKTVNIKKSSYFQSILKTTFICSLFVVFIVISTADLILIFIANIENKEIVRAFQLLTFSIIFSNISAFIGINILVSNSLNAYFLASALIGVVSMLLLLLIIIATNLISLITVVTAIVLYYFVEAIVRWRLSVAKFS